jgi:hypothetical protein
MIEIRARTMLAQTRARSLDPNKRAAQGLSMVGDSVPFY